MSAPEGLVTTASKNATSEVDPAIAERARAQMESRAAADAFYTDDWIARVSGRWQSQATRQDWETPMVVESAEHRLIAAE